MAEGVDNDMNQQQQQDGVPHGQEAFHTPSVHFQSPPLDLVNAPSLMVTVPSTQFSVNPGPKKKSAFQITSVTETRAHSRGDSNGYDLEDLNESDVTEIQIETIENSSSGNGNGGSRFKVVKIQRSEPYRRGRWLCHDFEQPSTTGSTSTHNSDTREVQSSTAASSGIFTANHVASEAASSHDPSLPNHRNAVEVTFSYLPSGQAPSVAPANVNFEGTLRKKDPDPHLSGTNNPDLSDLGSLATTKTLPANERIEKLAETARHTLGNAQSESASTVDELPIVNTIATAMDQITQIKSALLTVVHEEVQTLKDTITKLREENQDLKQENEKLKQIVECSQDT